jgi:hypothetical protein
MRQSEPVSEYQLIQAMKPALAAASEADSAALTLFRQHFLVMNALYQLRQTCWADGQWLEISPLSIRLVSLADSVRLSSDDASLPQSHAELNSLGLVHDVALAQWYLDWNHFHEANTESVDQLLASFWRRFNACDRQASALEQLGLGENAEWSQIQAAYRRLARQYHPDTGGDAQQFRLVREAYEMLRASRATV